MNTDNGKIGFSVELDSTQLNRDIKKSQQAFQELGTHVENECAKMDSAFSGIGRTFASIGAAWSLQELVGKVTTIRGEFQLLQKTMEVMLQSKSKAEALMAQMVQTAATTPFGLQEVAGGAKQLVAYGLEAEKINDTLIRLGNIASGLKIPLGDLIYLYGTTMAQGRLYMQDFNQFTNRGIPMIEELAKQFGVADNKVRGLVEDGKVGFPEVQKVIMSLTSEGGKFYNLMAEQSQLINGKISNLEDAFDSMFNKIGQQSEGAINDSLDTAMLLVENYEAVGTALMTLVADYGVYKATLMAVTAYTNACYDFEIAQLKTVVAEKGAEMDADLASAVAKGRMTAQRALEVQALRQEVQEKIKLAIANDNIAQAELAQARAKFESFQVTVALSKMRVTQAQQELASAQASGDATAIENAQTNLNTAIAERNSVARQSSILKRNMETAATNANATAQARATIVTKADTAAKKINVTTTSLLTLATNGLKNAFHTLTAAMAKNPFGIALIAITTILGALMTMRNTMSETSEEVERFGESAVKQSRNIETLLAVINNTSTRSKVHKDAVNELIKIYEEYGIKIDNERSKLDQLNQMREEAIGLIRAEGEERQKANLIASYEEAMNIANEDMRGKLQEALKNAEWDSTGLFDDYNYDELQNNAEELTAVIGGIIQGEAEELARLTGDAYAERLKTAEQKILKAYEDLGYATTRMSVTGSGHYFNAKTDVNEVKILEALVDKTRALIQKREELINSFNPSAIKAEAEAVDYEKMTFDELFKAAYKAKNKIAEVGKTEAKPVVNTSSIDAAITRTDELLGNIELLDGMEVPPWMKGNFPTPTPPPSEYNGPYADGYTPLLPSDLDDSNSNKEALLALDKRMIEALKTRKGTSDLLKEVNTALDSVDAGSDEERILLSMQRRLQLQQKKFSNASDTEDPAQRRANIEKAEQDAIKAMKDSAQQRMEMQRKLHFEEEQNRINLEQDAAVRKREQMRLDHEKELYDLEQQKEAAIKAEIQRQKAVFDAKENAKRANNKNYVKQNFTDGDVDQTKIAFINAEYGKLKEQTISLQSEATDEMWRSEAAALMDYLQSYGTFQQKKLAITEEYAEKIKNATSFGERVALEAERDSALSSLKMQELKSTIDWESAFSDLDKVSLEYLTKLKADLQDALKADELLPQDAKVIAERINGINDAIVTKKKEWQSAFGFVIPELEEMRRLEQEALDAQNKKIQAENEYKDSLKEVLDIQQEISNLLKDNGISVDAENIKSDDAQGFIQLFTGQGKDTGALTDLFSKLFGAEGNAATNFQNATNASGAANSAAAKVGGGAASTIAIIDKIIHTIDDSVQSTKELIEQLGVSDTKFGQGWNAFAESSSYAVKGWESLKSGDVMGVVNGVYGSLRTLGDALGKWGVGFMGDKDKTLHEDIEKLTATNDALIYAINGLSEVIMDASMSDVAAIYDRQMGLIDEAEANTREMMERSGAAYSNGFLGIGGHHSTNREINDNMSEDEWKRVTEVVGKSVSSAHDLWNLTSEEMRKLAIDAPDLYAKLKELADDGHEDAGQFMDMYIEYAQQRKELQDAYNEKLTNYSFDSLRNEFKSALLDMEMSASDFANKFNDMLVDSIAEALMTNKYDSMIQSLYDKWAGYMEDDGTLTDDELAELQKDKDAIYEAMQTDRDAIRALVGESSSQDSTKRGFESMSQDTADELNGRFTAIQMDTSSMREMMMQYGVEVSHIKMSTADIRQHTEELRNLALTAIDHLEDISRNTYELYEMNERLGKIEKNTRNM